MKDQDIQAFYLLKKAVGHIYAEAFPGVSPDLRSLSGKELARFQEHLMETVQGRVSEKWFYTHIKPGSNERLPRVDVLDLLSRYAGFDNWMMFRESHALKASDSEPALAPVSRGKRILKVVWIGAVAGVLVLLVSFVGKGNQKKSICFTDAVLGTPIVDSNLRVTQLIEGESPRVLVPETGGCIQISKQREILSLVVNVPYYQTDTLVRSWKEIQDEEVFALTPDDVANMLRYFSSWATDDRLKRSAQLKEMMSPSLKVIRMHSDGINGVEMYNRDEFIRFLLVFGQQRLEVLDTHYEQGLLTDLRFVVRN